MGTTVETCVTCESGDIEASPAIWMPFISHRAMDLPPLTIDSSTGLTNIPDGIAYALCKSMLCRRCGHLFVDYRFSESEMTRLYTDYRGDIYAKIRGSYEPGYAEMNQTLCNGISYLAQVEEFLRGLLPTSDLAVLDWGGDTGINTPFADRRSLLHIFDPSAKDADVADAVTFSDIPDERIDYDLIVLSNVLEHIPFPSDTLKAVRPFMGPQTVLYVEVPLERLQQSAQGPPYTGANLKKHWHEHINFFTAESMGRLLDSCGFAVSAHATLDTSLWQEKVGVSAVSVLQFACILRP